MEFSIYENFLSNDLPSQTAKCTKELFAVVKILVAQVKTLQSEIIALKSTAPSHTATPLYSELFKTKTSEEQVRDNLQLYKYRQESNELSKIASNVIISGIKPVGTTPEEIKNSDKVSVDKVLETIGYNTTHRNYPPTRIVRLPNLDKTPGTKILLTMQDTECKELICKNAKQLRDKGNDFVDIYINEDRTKSQRLIDKEQRDERNKRNNNLPDVRGRHLGETEDGSGKYYYWAIRSGVLKKILVEN